MEKITEDMLGLLEDMFTEDELLGMTDEQKIEACGTYEYAEELAQQDYKDSLGNY